MQGACHLPIIVGNFRIITIARHFDCIDTESAVVCFVLNKSAIITTMYTQHVLLCMHAVYTYTDCSLVPQTLWLQGAYRLV